MSYEMIRWRERESERERERLIFKMKKLNIYIFLCLFLFQNILHNIDANSPALVPYLQPSDRVKAGE
jgi:hypothetical protein